MKLKEILQEEASRSKDLEIEADDYGVKRLWVNEQHLIHFRTSPDDQYFYLYAKISSLPPSSSQVNIYATLLESNLFGKETGNAVLAIHAKSNSVILMKTFNSEATTFETYSKEFQAFIDYLVYWKEKMRKLLTASVNGSEDMLNIMSKRHQTILFI